MCCCIDRQLKLNTLPSFSSSPPYQDLSNAGLNQLNGTDGLISFIGIMEQREIHCFGCCC